MTFRSSDHETTGTARWEERDRSVGNLVGDLTSQVAHLARVEARLAAREVGEKAKRGAVGGGIAAFAGVLAFYGGAGLAAAAAFALALVWPAWLAALAVGVALLILAGIAALIARARLRRAVPPVPEETMDSARDDVRAMQGRMES
ncbi:hypothetical protein GCM10027447_11430 [Glycomyces halotolerans]